jgi:hypothetical protein
MRWKLATGIYTQVFVTQRHNVQYASFCRHDCATYLRYSYHIAKFLTPSDDHYLYCHLPAFAHFLSFLSHRFQGDCTQVAQQEMKKLSCVIIQTRTVCVTDI